MEDAGTVKKVLEGDVQAFQQVIEEYQKKLYDLAFRMIGNKQEAEDVLQDSFVKMYSRLSQYDPSYKFGNWAYTITLNTIRNFLRRKAILSFVYLDESPADAAPKPGLPDLSQNIEKDLHGRESLALLEKAVKKLPARLRETVILHYFQHTNIPETAGILGISENAVSVRLSRARESLHKELAGSFPELLRDAGNTMIKEPQI